ncbi:hypothetical protein B296_00041605 [Ensete ventricosum]|uniref:Uncharacterized protein n=1 Tax=Ensete ventricosum TaxID=4639 RepID=A0A426YSX3_ENSVE|nr:hypothetical protein B296_00041605 [Ensete ventricosum]
MALAAAVGYVTIRAEKRGGAPPSLFGADYMFRWEQQGEYMERRQAFLRSYHFCRKQGPREKALRVRRLAWARLSGVRRLPRLLWAKIRYALALVRGGRRRRPSHRMASVSSFQQLPHRRSASNISSSSSSAESPRW